MRKEECHLEKRKWFHPDIGFFNLVIVRVTIAIILSVSTIISLFIVYESNFEIDLSYVGWNNFITYFKVPLGTLATLIPLGAIYATHHRSIQTLEQMKQTNMQLKMTASQNEFSNYYKHLEEFEKYCKEHCGESVYKHRRNFYHLLFHNSKELKYSANTDFIEFVSDSLLVTINQLKENSKNKHTAKDLTDLITLNTEGLLALAQTDRNTELLYQYTQVSKSLYIRGDVATKNMVSFHVSCCFLHLMTKDIIEASSFDTNFRAPALLKVLLLDHNPFVVFESLSRSEDEIIRLLNKIRLSDEEDFSRYYNDELFLPLNSKEFEQMQSIKIVKAANMNFLNKKLNKQ
ncbi:hypothetical protein NYG22_001961 [Vibrio alginolyticus]|nr:hypothetical protein [Vibrio alginolyticus]